MTVELGKIGIWAHPRILTPDVVAEVERLGYGAVWLGGSPDGDLHEVDERLAATERIAVATGIVNMWKDDATTVAASYHRIEQRFPGRFLLGVGIGHPEATQEYVKPYDKMVAYLDELDAAGVPKDRMALAALGPKALKLAAERTAGAHPYLTTPEHTRQARELVGSGVLLAPEQKVVLDPDDEHGRATGREMVKFYLGLRNYVSNLKRLGFTDADVATPGSDRLVDALALHGDAATVAQGVKAHLAAGADHVCVQVLGDNPLAGYQALAEFLLAADN
jgi:probable F420-dependent oxidoreductase